MSKKKTNYIDNEDVIIDDDDLEAISDYRAEQLNKFLVLGVLFVIVVLVAGIFLRVSSMIEKHKPEKVVQEYFTALNNADIMGIRSVMDPKSSNGDSFGDLVKVFNTYEEMGLKYSVTYTINEVRPAKKDELTALVETLYTDKQVVNSIKKGYVVDCNSVMKLTYNGQETPYAQNMLIVCYEKDGTWYIGGNYEDPDSTEKSELDKIKETIDGSTEEQSTAVHTHTK